MYFVALFGAFASVIATFVTYMILLILFGNSAPDRVASTGAEAISKIVQAVFLESILRQ